MVSAGVARGGGNDGGRPRGRAAALAEIAICASDPRIVGDGSLVAAGTDEILIEKLRPKITLTS